MSLLNIIQYPDPRLKKIATSVAVRDIASKHIQSIVSDMFETMYQANGVGLAAIQVDIPLQIITIDLSDQKKNPFCLINPNITDADGMVMFTEGCLSFPGIYTDIKRYKKISVKFFNIKGEEEWLEAEELFSICLQHEIDHLHGKTFFDHLSKLKQALLRKKLEKLRKRRL